MRTRTTLDRDIGNAFKTPRDFLFGVKRFAEDGRLDRRLEPFRIRAAVGSDEQTGAADPYGGFAVPKSLFSGDLLSAALESDPIASRVFRIPMDAPQVSVTARVDKNHSSSVSGGLAAGRRPETVAMTASRMKLERIELQATFQYGFTFATEEIVMDSTPAFGAILARAFQDEFAANLIRERLFGTGVGEFEGIMNCPALITVSKQGGQAASTINFENVVDMRSQCWGYENAIWLANHDTYSQLAKMELPVGTGGSAVWHQTGEGEFLLGRPIFFSEFTKTLGTTGDIILANFGEYLEGSYQPFQSAESVFVRWENHEKAFKFFQRNDGRSWWRAVLTPRNSTTALSPFICLQTRS